jgi:hypothetical protein
MGKDRKHIIKLSRRLDGDSMLKCYNHTVVLVLGRELNPHSLKDRGILRPKHGY